MEIRELRVANFGKLHDYSLSLQEGLNILCEENGFGKTTLSSFIAVMFFGFDGEKKRAILDSQRKRYAPWQGGTYGGSIRFSEKGKEYLLERSFGTKDGKEDQFALYDAATMLPSRDFSEKIGEEILGIDRDSFLRTAFMGQLDMKTAATSAINAKMGDLAGEMADLSEFEEVAAGLRGKLVQLSATRKTGELHKLSDAISELNGELQKEEAKRGALKQLEEQKLSFLSEKQREEQKREELNEKLKELSKKKDSYTALVKLEENYKNSRDRLTELKEKLKADQSFFPKGIPEGELLKSMNRESQNYAALTGSFGEGSPSGRRLSELQRKFSYAPLPEIEEELQATQRILGELEKEQSVLREQESLRSRKEQELLGVQQEMKSIQAAIEEQKKALSEFSRRREEEAKRRKPISLWILLEIAALVFGIVLLFMRLPLGFAGCLFLSLIFLLLGFLTGKKEKEGKIENSTSPEESIQKYLRSLETSLREKQEKERALKKDTEAIQTQISELRRETAEKRDRILQFCEKARISGKQDLSQELLSLRSDFESLRNLQAEAEVRKREAEKSRLTLNKFFEDFGFSLEGKNYQEGLNLVSRRISQLSEDRKAVQEKEEELKKFERSEEFRKIAEAEQLKQELERESMDKLHEEQEAVQQRLDSSKEMLNIVTEQIQELEEELEEIENVKLQQQSLKEQQRDLKHHRDILEKTEKFLTEAKNSLAAKYMAPFRNAFEKYYGMIDTSASKEYTIDADLKVSVREQGLKRELGFLSTGYQDLVHLCSRMAMLDSMYPGEKPLLVMDDPFVNLDAEKYQRAMDFLRKAAEEYQILYFSCRE